MIIESYLKLSVIHFSALGKPWFYPTDEVRRLRPNPHPAPAFGHFIPAVERLDPSFRHGMSDI